MARPAKLSLTRGCETRRGKSRTPRSRHQCGREIVRAERCVESLLSSGGSKRAARNASEPPMTSRQMICPKGLERPSRACHGEGNRLRSLWAAEADRGTPPAGLSRDIGDGMRARPAAEQERPSSMALEWEADAIRRSRNAGGIERESEEAVVPMKRGRRTSRREGPLLESCFRKR